MEQSDGRSSVLGVEDQPRDRATPSPWADETGDPVPPRYRSPEPTPSGLWLRVAAALAVVILAVKSFGAGALLMILALIVSVALHELGHYWVARRSGMKVTEYFIGIGPRIWSFRRGEVEYGVKAVPIAAYVKIIGMSDMEEVDPADEDRAYRSQGTFKRVATVLAGPVTNIGIGFALLLGTFLFATHPTDAWKVNTVEPTSAAAAAGLVPGDQVLSINGQPVKTFASFHDQIDELAGDPVTLQVMRGGNEIALPATIGWRFDAAAAALVPSTPPVTVDDVIVAADGRPIATYDDLRALLGQSGDPVKLAIRRNKSDYELPVNRPLALPPVGASGFLGVRPEAIEIKETPVGAVGEAWRMGGLLLTENGKGLLRLFSPAGIKNYVGQVADGAASLNTTPDTSKPKLVPVNGSPEAKAGSAATADRPVSMIGIVSFGSQAAESSLASFFIFIALVNLALAVFNLLPVLPFDGGHAVIALYEGVRGRIQGAPYRADMNKMVPILYGVLSFLALLAITSVMLDIVKPL